MTGPPLDSRLQGQQRGEQESPSSAFSPLAPGWVSALRPGIPREGASQTHTSAGQCEGTTVQGRGDSAGGGPPCVVLRTLPNCLGHRLCWEALQVQAHCSPPTLN